MNGVYTELPWLYTGLASYVLATVVAIQGVIRARGGSAGATVNRSYEHIVLGFAVVGVALLAMSIGERWIRIGHGPFVNLFELLMSQLCSLGLVYTLVYWRFPVLRPSAVVALPLMWILGVWVLTLNPEGSPFPPTYHPVIIN